MLSRNKSQHKIRGMLSICVSIILFALLLCGCQPKVYRVGILSGLIYFSNIADSFKAEMTELGYVEGKNIVYDLQKTQFEPDREKQILQKFVADKVDLIFTYPTEPALEAKAITQGTNIPVVFAYAFIEGVDLVKSVREPGGKVTGVRFPGPDVSAKTIELLHQAVPKAKRVLVYSMKGYPNSPSQLDVLVQAAGPLGISLVQVPVSSPAELIADLKMRAASKDIGIDAILGIADPLAKAPGVTEAIDTFDIEHKLPSCGPIGDLANILAVSIDNIVAGKQAAGLADKIIKGTPAGTIPVISADTFVMINLKAAALVGITIPEDLLMQATQITR